MICVFFGNIPRVHMHLSSEFACVADICSGKNVVKILDIFGVAYLEFGKLGTCYVGADMADSSLFGSGV